MMSVSFFCRGFFKVFLFTEPLILVAAGGQEAAGQEAAGQEAAGKAESKSVPFTVVGAGVGKAGKGKGKGTKRKRESESPSSG